MSDYDNYTPGSGTIEVYSIKRNYYSQGDTVSFALCRGVDYFETTPTEIQLAPEYEFDDIRVFKLCRDGTKRPIHVLTKPQPMNNNRFMDFYFPIPSVLIFFMILWIVLKVIE